MNKAGDRDLALTLKIMVVSLIILPWGNYYWMNLFLSTIIFLFHTMAPVDYGYIRCYQVINFIVIPTVCYRTILAEFHRLL